MPISQTRIIFRLVEFAPGGEGDNPLLASELYPLLLDALPMALALVALNLMHPGFVLRGPESEFPKLSKDEKKHRRELKQQLIAQQKEERRNTRAQRKEMKQQQQQQQKRDSTSDDNAMV